MFRATKEFKRDMAHRLPSHKGKCFNVHWHTYKALITVKAEELQKEWAEHWMIKDFSNFKPIKDWINDNWDHAYVWSPADDVRIYLEKQWFKTDFIVWSPTAENMSKLLYEKAKELIEWVEVEKVVVYETPTSFAEYSE